MTLPTPKVDLVLERGALPAAGGTVHALLHVDVDFPEVERDRDPLALALVLDRSGSMTGDPLEHAKHAAARGVDALRDGDRVAVVAYDQQVDVVVPSTVVGPDRGGLRAAIGAIRPGGTTALHAGWVEGGTQVLLHPVASRQGRVVLLTDGLANVGVTDPDAIAEDVARLAADGVTTSAIGLGRHFDEVLLRRIADAGAGTYVFVEDPAQLDDWFETELAGLSARRGSSVRVTLSGRGVRIVRVGPGARLEGDVLHLPDLVAGLPRRLPLTLEVAPGATLDGLRLTWDDTLTGAREAVEPTLTVPALADAAYAGAPADPAVVTAARATEATERMREVETLARRGALPKAATALNELRRDVAAWPEPAAREAQLAAIDRLVAAVRDQDAGLAAKRAHAMVAERARGVSNADLKTMAMSERAWTDAHKAQMARPPRAAETDAGSRFLQVFPLLRPDGSRARLEVVLGDLTHEAVDAIVNPSNRGLFGTAGVDGAVHARGGPELTAACRAIGGIDYGQAVATPGFRLPAARVLHTTTVPWKDGSADELATLDAAYTACFDLARRLRVRSLALPAVGTGAYGYPPKAATEVAVAVALRETMASPDLELVRFVLLEPKMATLYRRAIAAAVPQLAA